MRLSKVEPAKRTLGIAYAIRDIVVLAEQIAKSGKKNALLEYWRPESLWTPNTASNYRSSLQCYA